MLQERNPAKPISEGRVLLLRQERQEALRQAAQTGAMDDPVVLGTQGTKRRDVPYAWSEHRRRE